MPLPIFIVTITPGSSVRYIDSLWISEASATARMEAVSASLARAYHRDWGVRISNGVIEDAALEPPSPKLPSMPGQPEAMPKPAKQRLKKAKP
jgi:hypothetical protein